MKKFLVIALAILCAAAVPAAAQMTDQQVIDYVKQGLASGKSESTMQRELLSRGVTVEQVKRIKAQVEQDQGKSRDEDTSDLENEEGNPRSKRPALDPEKDSSKSQKSGDRRYKGKNQEKSQGKDQAKYKGKFKGKDRNLEGMPEDLDETEYEDDEDFESEMEEMDLMPPYPMIYGHDIFTNTEMSFEPNENTATPEDYKLGPGDEVIIDIWGYNEASLKQTISPEGKINVSQVGPIHLSGLTIADASVKIKRALMSKYSGIGGESPNSEVSVTLGNIRSIQVNVMGEAMAPGTYRLSSFSTVFTALYRAGGVTETGSLRAIQVVRGGKLFATVDVYGYLFKGSSDSDIRLQEGDVIVIPPYVSIVDMQGGVKRPMLYELAQGETVADAIAYAGGFASDAHRGDVSVERKSGAERSVITVTAAEMASSQVEDGDVITVASTFEKYSNRLEVQGYVYRPGLYQLGDSIKTVKDLVNAAGGLREDAFMPRAIIQRERADLSLETVSVAIGDVMSGKAVDVALAKNDILIISGIHDIESIGSLTINGMVLNPGVFTFAENTTVEDLIVQAGGLLDGASTARLEVSRRVMESSGLTQSDTLGYTFHFAIKDGLAVDGADEFVLKPYDVVSVRKSPTYAEQRFVTITGEVAFPGTYVIQSRTETVTDIIARAGGPTSRAYLQGGVVLRQMNDEEEQRRSATKRMVTRSDDEEVDEEKINLDKSNYTVGIMMDKAYENPHTDYDLTVREGDEIIVPEFLNTVSIQGDVMYPNVVQYIKGKPLRYYIDSAGGYGERARRSGAFIVSMNGNVKKAHAGTKIEPGVEIVVPSKGDKKTMTTAEVLSLGTSTASLATMIATLVKLF